MFHLTIEDSMKSLFCTTIILLSTFFCSSLKAEQKNDKWLKNAVETSSVQLKLLAEEASKSNGKLPRNITNNSVKVEGIYNWTSGFFPGSLWYEYQLTNDEYFKTKASEFTNLLYDLKDYKKTHDLGFMMYCSYGNAYRLTKNDTIPQVLVTTANSLIGRYNDTIKAIRSWDWSPEKWNFPVIIDNMMNLELLFWASDYTGDSKYKEVAINHANTTLKHHFRDNMTSYHVVSYNKDGSVQIKQTHQGYADESAWARGQAWALYGYVVCFRETGDARYLEAAHKIANMIMTYPNMPNDKIPYWDMDHPDIPNTYRDTSAAALIASALLELSTLTEVNDRIYYTYAEDILKSLSSERYLAAKGTNHGFLIKHSVGNLPSGSEIDTSINYTDYYYLECLNRYINLKR